MRNYEFTLCGLNYMDNKICLGTDIEMLTLAHLLVVSYSVQYSSWQRYFPMTQKEIVVTMYSKLSMTHLQDVSISIQTFVLSAQSYIYLCQVCTQYIRLCAQYESLDRY